jgi:chromosome segregation protein
VLFRSVEVQEISLRTEENVDSEVSFKKRELERSKISLKQLLRDEEELDSQTEEIKKDINKKEELLEKKRKQEEELTEKFRKLISERDSFQKKIRDNEINISQKQNIIYNLDQEMNNLKIDSARVSAEIENLETEMLDFHNIEIIKTNKESLVEKLNKTQELLSQIGSVNLRSLEVYDTIKKEYDAIQEKTTIIAKEKEGILKIIHEIDIKKKKSFMQTLDSINEIFSSNFSQLSPKGHVFLDLEDKKEPFNGGVNIVVKTGHGKYFDVKSLSGGEQTLVALSLIFAIQELKPYYFYIFDEIDAALDKRNSERLAELLKKYMKRGQYILISHNDEVIANSTNLYGVSMSEGVSKIVSLKI